MASNVINLPTQTLSGPYIGPGLPASSSISSATSSGKQIVLTADTNPDELASLQPLALKQGTGDPGVQFPGLIMREEQTKSLAVHMYPNLDSARVENMGRNPAVFKIRGVFTNNIYPGHEENWTPGLLFPNTFMAVYQALLDNNDIIFQHPMFGDISVQVRSWTYELNPKLARDGAFLDMELVETIGTNNPITETVAGPKGSGIARTAADLDATIAALPANLNPPNLSFSQFFSQVSNLIDQAVSYPNNVVTALNTQVFTPLTNGINQVNKGISALPGAIATAPATLINGVTTGVISVAGAASNAVSNSVVVANGLITAPAYAVQNTLAAIQNSKNAVLASVLQTANSNFETISGIPVPNPFPAMLGTSYTQSSFAAMQSILHLNNTPSQNAFQLMDKLMRGIVDLMQHYTDQNNVECTRVIIALRALLLQVQQKQSALSLNTTNQSVKVFNYVTLTNMTWMQLAKHLNNKIDDLMALNQGIITDLWVPAFTTINYYQS